MGRRKVTNSKKSLSPNNLNEITNGKKQKHQTTYDEVTESCYMTSGEKDNFTREKSFNVAELMEEKSQKDLSFETDYEKKAFNYSISKLSYEDGSLSHEIENCFPEDDKFDEPEDVAKNKFHENKGQFGTSKVESLINLRNRNKKFNLDTSKLSNKEMGAPVKKVNMKKNPKTWDKELENLASYGVISDLDNEVIFLPIKKTGHKNYSNNYENREGNEYSTVVQRKAQVLDSDSVKPSLKNKYNSSKKYKQNEEISSLLPQKGQEKISRASPNENIINKAMKSMEMCTLPYLTACQERENTWMNDIGKNEDSSKSPTLTEYSYSIQEIQSTVLFATRNSLNSTKKYGNFTQTGESKARMCKIEQKSILHTNFKQENITSITKSKDSRSSKSPVAIKLNKPQSKDPFNNKYKEHDAKETTSTTNSILGTIMKRLQVNINSCNVQNVGSFEDDSNKLLKTKKLKTKQATASLENSVCPEKPKNLNWNTDRSRRQADAYYNLRKRKCKSPEEFQVDDFQANQFIPKKGRKVNTGGNNRNSVKVERSFEVILNEENSFENNDTERDSASPRKRKDSKRLKSIMVKDSKLNETLGYSREKKMAVSKKKETSPKKGKFRGSLNKNTTSVESEEDVFITMDEYNQKAAEKETKLCGNDPRNLIKNPQIPIKNSVKNLNPYGDKNYISRPNFPKEQKKSSSKENSNKEAGIRNYKMYLEKIFNKKSSPERTESDRKAPFTIQEQRTTRKKLIADNNENEELFSLSSSDSDDNEESQKNPSTLGLLGNVLDDCEEE